MQQESLSFACWDRLFTLGSLMYEKHENNFDTVQDRLLEPSGYDYNPGGLANIRKKDRNVPKITWGFRGLSISHILWSMNDRTDTLVKKIKDQRLYFFYIDQTRLDKNAIRKIG